MTVTADGKGAVFDVPSEHVEVCMCGTARHEPGTARRHVCCPHASLRARLTPSRRESYA
jgi:hypothetical protein